MTNSQLSSALVIAISPVVITDTRGREMPLKNPRMAQTAIPSGPPSIRGRQNAIACCSISGSRPNAWNIAPPAQASAAYIGRLSAPAQIAIHVACEARQRRRLPSA